MVKLHGKISDNIVYVSERIIHRQLNKGTLGARLVLFLSHSLKETRCVSVLVDDQWRTLEKKY